MNKQTLTITEKQKEILKKLYTNKKDFRISEHDSSGNPYFLFSKGTSGTEGFEFTFIWIGDFLWQYKYFNSSCTAINHWINPDDLLNKLLDAEF